MEKCKKSHTKTTNLEISGPTWNEKFDLLDRSYSVLDI